MEYQDFKFDVPLSGAITFKIMFEPGVLPEVFPHTRERRTRKPWAQGTELQDVAPAAEAGETAPQEAQPAASLPAETAEALAQALGDAQAASEPVDALAEASSEAIKTEVIDEEATGRVLVITAEPESAETVTQPEIDVPTKKPTAKGKSKKGAATTKNADK